MGKRRTTSNKNKFKKQRGNQNNSNNNNKQNTKEMQEARNATTTAHTDVQFAQDQSQALRQAVADAVGRAEQAAEQVYLCQEKMDARKDQWYTDLASLAEDEGPESLQHNPRICTPLVEAVEGDWRTALRAAETANRQEAHLIREQLRVERNLDVCRRDMERYQHHTSQVETAAALQRQRQQAAYNRKYNLHQYGGGGGFAAADRSYSARSRSMMAHDRYELLDDDFGSTGAMHRNMSLRSLYSNTRHMNAGYSGYSSLYGGAGAGATTSTWKYSTTNAAKRHERGGQQQHPSRATSNLHHTKDFVHMGIVHRIQSAEAGETLCLHVLEKGRIQTIPFYVSGSVVAIFEELEERMTEAEEEEEARMTEAEEEEACTMEAEEATKEVSHHQSHWVVQGPSGCGKTALLTLWAILAAKKYETTVLYVHLDTERGICDMCKITETGCRYVITCPINKTLPKLYKLEKTSTIGICIQEGTPPDDALGNRVRDKLTTLAPKRITTAITTTDNNEAAPVATANSSPEYLTVPLWSIQDYVEAASNEEFLQCQEGAMEQLFDQDPVLEQWSGDLEQQVRQKHYWTGGIVRYMFGGTIQDAKETLDIQILYHQAGVSDRCKTKGKEDSDFDDLSAFGETGCEVDKHGYAHLGNADTDDDDKDDGTVTIDDTNGDTNDNDEDDDMEVNDFPVVRCGYTMDVLSGENYRELPRAIRATAIDGEPSATAFVVEQIQQIQKVVAEAWALESPGCFQFHPLDECEFDADQTYESDTDGVVWFRRHRLAVSVFSFHVALLVDGGQCLVALQFSATKDDKTFAISKADVETLQKAFPQVKKFLCGMVVNRQVQTVGGGKNKNNKKKKAPPPPVKVQFFPKSSKKQQGKQVDDCVHAFWCRPLVCLEEEEEEEGGNHNSFSKAQKPPFALAVPGRPRKQPKRAIWDSHSSYYGKWQLDNPYAYARYDYSSYQQQQQQQQQEQQEQQQLEQYRQQQQQQQQQQMLDYFQRKKQQQQQQQQSPLDAFGAGWNNWFFDSEEGKGGHWGDWI